MSPPAPEPAPPRPRRRAFALAAVAIAIAGAFGLAEVVLRALDLPRTAPTFGFLGGILGEEESYVTDRERFWMLRPSPPWQNRLGLRGYLPADGPPGPETLRVACVGDSCTFGAHVRYEESYAMVLERLLRDALPHRRVETIVAGVPGYTTWQDRVLFERHVARFEPHVTVLYCGGWNDFVPALGETDRERATGWRILRLLRGAAAESEPTEAERQARWQDFRDGRARDGRRVPLEEFEENVRAMVAAARAAGGRVVLVVPPLDEVTFATTPIAAEYRAAVHQIAADVAAPMLDAPALFESRRAGVPESQRSGFPSPWPCLYDWVHPSVFGHAVLGEGLFALIRAQGWFADVDPVPAPRVDAVELHGNGLTVRGDGFVTAGFDRLFAGPWWIADCDVLDDGALRAVLPRGVPAGRYPLVMVGRFGARAAGFGVEFAAPALQATVRRDDDGAMHVTLACDGPPGWRVSVWLAPTRRAEPEPTRHGDFWLAGTAAARPEGQPEFPFLFERVELEHVDGELGADGTWQHRIDLDAATAASLPGVLHLQGIVFEPPSTGRASLTDAVELRIR